MSKEWFILQFKQNAHHKANKNLSQQDFETFLPLNNTTSRNTSQFINANRPLFPGYMFIRFDKAECEWHKINNTYGVSRLITFNSTLKSIPDIFVNELMKRYDLSGNLIPIKTLKKGDQVKLLKGPFANFAATVEKYEDNQRVWVLMDLMGRKSKIQAPTGSLQLSD